MTLSRSRKDTQTTRLPHALRAVEVTRDLEYEQRVIQRLFVFQISRDLVWAGHRYQSPARGGRVVCVSALLCCGVFFVPFVAFVASF
ncbi:MAG: hypothetical protein DMF84_16010 [Acidobacteria bacterium]|nr:MAG: hypothetical protein DMF84_16010 [Acidobacteriota bacterium]